MASLLGSFTDSLGNLCSLNGIMFVVVLFVSLSVEQLYGSRGPKKIGEVITYGNLCCKAYTALRAIQL